PGVPMLVEVFEHGESVKSPALIERVRLPVPGPLRYLTQPLGIADGESGFSIGGRAVDITSITW
ncbi:MAG: hypothetical protein AAGK78_03845, partial [Planctomycetota bacterium]